MRTAALLLTLPTATLCLTCPAARPLLQRPPLARRRVASTAVRCEEESGGILDGLIPKGKNPYLTSSADRMRYDKGEGAVTGMSGRSGGREAAEDRLAADIARFKAERAIDPSAAAEQGEEETTLLQNVIDTLGTVLTYNFFIICAFFAWFLVGVGAQFGAQNLVIISAFRSAWDVIIMPLLTTHMTLTFLSAGLERLSGAGDNA